MLQGILGGLFLALVGLFVVQMVVKYKNSSSTGLARVWDAASGSATILWARIVQISSMLVLGLVNLADAVGQPHIADQIKGFLKPEYVPIVLFSAFLISEFARRRTL